MRTVRFLRDTDPAREGGPGFKSGQVHSLRDDSARRWITRGAAEYVTEVVALPEASPAPTPAEPINEPAAPAADPEEEKADGDPVDGPADVEGEDGAGSGERAEPADKPAGGTSSGRGRGGRRSSNK